MQCRQCHHEVPADAQFCPECGARLAITCPECGTDNGSAYKFCKNCGRALGLVPAAGKDPARFASPQSYTPRHLAEFYMIEPEMAFCDLNGNQDLAEAFLKSQVEQVLEACRPDLEFLAKWYDPELLKTLEDLLAARFERMTYTEAIEQLGKSGKAFEFPTHWG